MNKKTPNNFNMMYPVGLGNKYRILTDHVQKSSRIQYYWPGFLQAFSRSLGSTLRFPCQPNVDKGQLVFNGYFFFSFPLTSPLLLGYETCVSYDMVGEFKSRLKPLSS